MNKLRLTAVSLLFAAGAATAFSGVVLEMDSTDLTARDAGITKSRLLVEGSKLKMELVVGDAASDMEAGGDMIFDAEARQMIGIDHSSRAYYVMDEQVLEQMAQAMKQMREQFAASSDMLSRLPPEAREALENQGINLPGMPGAEAETVEVSAPEFRRTSETAQKQGYRVRKYEMYVDDEKQQELWVTDWNNISGSEDIAAAFKSMAAFMQEMFSAMGDMTGNASLMGEDDGIFAALESINGFPVLTREFENGEVVSESSLTSVREETFAAGTFEPPAGYRRQSLSGM